jgi:NAD(P)-dependent dehydrogenase (short-subunit alcohol dehydrogenase family)
MTTLNQKVCIVTGGGSGIGRATVLAMAGLGARVAVVGRTRSKLDEVVREVGSVGGSARAYVADVSDWDAVATMTADVIERWGRLDVLVNNAGSNVRHRGVLDTTPEEIERLIAINLTGTIFCTKAALPRMLEQGAGSIVNVSSMAALRPGMMSGVAYGASKAGVNNFNQFLNDELQHTGVRACVISPGEVVTPILDDRGVPPDAAARETMCQPEDVAAAVVFVATLPARAMVPEMVVMPTVSRDASAELQARPNAP